jgi:aminopeptidase
MAISDKRAAKEIAKILVDYSCKVKKGEKVYISADLLAKPLVLEIYRRVLEKGAYPSLYWGVEGFSPIYYNTVSEEQLKNFPEILEFTYNKCSAFMFIRAPANRMELKDCDQKKIAMRQKTVKPINDIRLKKKWVIFDWPTKTLAKDAKMPFSKYKNFVFSATIQNWKEKSRKWKKIADFLNKSDKIRMVAEGTDLTLSVKGRKAIVGDGTYNMPDGEVFTSMVDDSANGKIRFTYPLRYGGRRISNITLVFKKGKVVKFNSGDNKALKTMLDTDTGSRRLGELGIGLNPGINKFTDNLLLDEKINGTIHLAVGAAYKDCKGKNESAVHADIVKDMHKGKMFADGKLIYKNGKFLI